MCFSEWVSAQVQGLSEIRGVGPWNMSSRQLWADGVGAGIWTQVLWRAVKNTLTAGAIYQYLL